MRFSQRMGYKPVREIIQKESLDESLRTGLWNVFYKFYGITSGDYDINQMYEDIWINYYKFYLDDFNSEICWIQNKDHFLHGKWCEVFDFLEFIVESYVDEEISQRFMEECNFILKRELSTYRFVDGNIMDITSEEEISEIEECINKSPFTVQTHLKNAVALLADRNNPDYRNSIKESISAVESICKLIANDEKTTLGRALKKIEKESTIELHPSLKEAFAKLYDYTNDADGIRHSLKKKSNLDFEDAKFMLISCSAFTNYLLTKVSKSGISLE